MLSPVFRETFQSPEGPSPEWNIGVGDVLENTLRLTSTRATALSGTRHHFLMRKRGYARADNPAEDSPATVVQAIVDHRAHKPANGYSCRTFRSRHPQMMPFPNVIDLRFPAEETRSREPKLRRRLDRTLPAATQLEVFLAQPAVANFFVDASVAGGGFETAALLKRGEKPDTCC